MLTSEIPFLEPAVIGDSFLDSSASAMSTMSVDMELLYNYCRGQPFPIKTLLHHGVSPDGIGFVMSLMAANPVNRVSAADALKARWLDGTADSDAVLLEAGASRAPPSRAGTHSSQLTIRPQFPVSPSPDRYPTVTRSGISGQLPQSLLVLGEIQSIRTTPAQASRAPPPMPPRTQSGERTVRPNRPLASQVEYPYRTGDQGQQPSNSPLRSVVGTRVRPPLPLPLIPARPAIKPIIRIRWVS